MANDAQIHKAALAERQITARSRISILVLGPLYLWFLSGMFSATTQAPVVITAPFVILFAAVIGATIAVFCARFVAHEGSRRRVRLSSILLLFIPAALYLTAIRCLVGDLPMGEMSLIGWILFAIFLLIFVTLTTAVLLRLTEAIVWLAALIRRRK